MIDGQPYRFIDAASMGVRQPVANPTAHLMEQINLAEGDKAIIYSMGTGFSNGTPTSSSAQIKIVRIEPDVEDSLDYFMEPMSQLSWETDSGKVSYMMDVGEKLKKSPAYQEMLEDLKSVAQSDL
jgi:hypothetical protein